MLTPAQLIRRIRRPNIRVGVVGGTGYVGAELVRLLAEHPRVRLQAVTSRSQLGKCVNEHFPYIAKFLNLRFVAPDHLSMMGCDVVIFATPPGTTMQYAQSLLKQGIRVIDLSPDFSLGDEAAWESYFGAGHPCAALISSAVFGLPEINRRAIRKAALVNSPGSYSTAIILGVLPLLQAKLLQASSLMADIVVGMTAHGRVALETEVSGENPETLQAFDVDLPLVKAEAGRVISSLHGGPMKLNCTLHSAPLISGLHATLTFEVSPRINLFELYRDFYAKEIFVDVLPAGCVPETRNVRDSNYCKIAPHRQKDGQATILVALDNLIKGAAGQAIQNLNIMFGLREAEGLRAINTDPKGHTA